MIPEDLVTNSLLLYFFSFLTNQKQQLGFQQVVGLVTRIISVFCLKRVGLYFEAMQNSRNFYKGVFLHVILVCITVLWDMSNFLKKVKDFALSSSNCNFLSF